MERFVKQFIWGISVLTAYLHYNNRINYSDINILCEGFMRDLLNILFDLKLRNPNQHNSPGYDLISKHDQIVVQVSTSCTSNKVKKTFSTLNRIIPQTAHRKKELEKELAEAQKILDSIEQTIVYHRSTLNAKDKKLDKEEKARLSSELEQLETRKTNVEIRKSQISKELAGLEDIRGYNVQFFFLCENADVVIKYRKKGGFEGDIPKELRFCQSNDILCFSSLIHRVQELSPVTDIGKINQLLQFMVRNPNIFDIREFLPPPSDKVSKVINEYADNFVSPLFLHRFFKDTQVTLKNLFVEPELSCVNVVSNEGKSYHNIIELLDSFIWDSQKDRLMFIDGDAAIGKTSLISWLCYHYRELDDIGKAIFLNTQFVCVRLRDLSLSKDSSAENCILEYLSYTSMDAFERQYGNALIVLEGADELGIVNGIESSMIERFILDVRHAFSRHKIVITSRPKFINMNLFSGSTQIFSYQHYSLNHFSFQKRAEWISNYENKKKCGQVIPFNTKQYLCELNDDEAAGVADTPLALYLLVACDMTEPLKNNKWALYHEIFHKAIRNTPYNEAFHSNGASLSHRALQTDEFAEAVYTTIGEIANRMYVNFKEERFYISNNELDDIVFNMHGSSAPERINAIRKCCVLCAYWKENSNIGALEFYHNNIRAFFMSEYIYRRFCDVRLFPLSTKSIQQFVKLSCEVFQHGVIARSTWAQTFSFLYYRMQYEKDYPLTSTHIPNEQEIQKAFFEVLREIVTGPAMWNHSFSGMPYESIKTVFFNFAIFLRIWLSLSAPIPLTSFADNDFQSFWRNNELFKDWMKLFSDAIEISKNSHIAFGSHMKYQDMSFDYINLSGACFEGSTFVQSAFRNSDLKRANFTNCLLEVVDFSGANLSDADFRGAKIVNANFSSADISNANFQNATVVDSILPEKSAYFSGTTFTDANFINANCRNIDFKNTLLTGATFQSCAFRNIKFPKLFKQATFVDCSITKCFFTTCSELYFRGENSVATHSRFTDVVRDCSFEYITLSDSDWSNSIVDNVLFVHTKINGLTFRAAEIGQISLLNCSIDGNIDLLQARIRQSAFNLLKEHTPKILNLSSAQVTKDDG